MAKFSRDPNRPKIVRIDRATPSPQYQQRPLETGSTLVSVENLAVAKDNSTIVSGIIFSVKRGEILGLLGPSGAGKTTIMKVLTTGLKPSSGRVTIGGYDVSSPAVKRLFGYVPQETQLYEEMTLVENVVFFGGQYGVDRNYLYRRAFELAKIVDLPDKVQQRVRNLSGGQKKRASIAVALGHNPQLLILDEPTSGLDPGTRRSFWRFLKLLNQSRNVTMMVSTHFLDEAEFCDSVFIINRGKMIAHDSPEKLVRDMPGEGRAIEVEFYTLDEQVMARLKQFEQMAKRAGVAQLVDLSGFRMKVFVSNIQQDMPRVIKMLSEFGLTVKSANVVDVNIEDVFLRLTGEQFKIDRP